MLDDDDDNDDDDADNICEHNKIKTLIFVEKLS